VIDLGAGHAPATEEMCGRILAALKFKALLNESVGTRRPELAASPRGVGCPDSLLTDEWVLQ